MTKKSHIALISLMSASLYMGGVASAFAGTACQGHSKMTSEQQHVLPVSEADGHILMLSQDSGPMESIGVIGNGTATDRGMNRLFQGNGEGQGYHTLNTKDGAVVVQWSGTVKTIIKDNIPNTSFKGTWEIIHGSGKFQNMEGYGDYDGYFTSETTRVINWKGTCTLASN